MAKHGNAPVSSQQLAVGLVTQDFDFQNLYVTIYFSYKRSEVTVLTSDLGHPCMSCQPLLTSLRASGSCRCVVAVVAVVVIVVGPDRQQSSPPCRRVTEQQRKSLPASRERHTQSLWLQHLEGKDILALVARSASPCLSICLNKLLSSSFFGPFMMFSYFTVLPELDLNVKPPQFCLAPPPFDS